MARQRVSDLMAHDHGDAVVVLSHWHHPLPKNHFVARKRKGVDFFSLNKVELPFVVWLICRRGDTLTDATELSLPIASGRETILLQCFLIGLVAEF